MTMHIVTWNTQWCKGIDAQVSPQRIIDSARALVNFDVLCLQEISVNYLGLTGQSPADQVQAIRDLLPGYQVVFGAAMDEQPAGRRRQQFGNLIASRLPILQTQQLNLPSPIDHSQQHARMSRLCLVCTIQAPWGPVRIMTTHLEYHSQQQRLAQARMLREWHEMASLQTRHRPQPGPPDTPYQEKPDTLDAILCGDFNFPPDSPEYAEITCSESFNAFVDAWRISNPGEPHPLTSDLHDLTESSSPLCRDFFFVSQSLQQRIRHMAVDMRTQASDHQPVCLSLDTSLL